MRIHRLPLWACALLLVPACASASSPSAPLVPPGATVVTRPLATARRGGPATGAACVTAVPRLPAPGRVVRTPVRRHAAAPVCKPVCKPVCQPARRPAVLPLAACCPGGT